MAALVLPAAAHAATKTVKAGDGPCAAADTACGSLTEAAAGASPNDVFTVSPGTYDAAEFTVGGVEIRGEVGVVVNGTMKFSGPGATPSKLSKIALTQSNGTASGIEVSSAGGLELSDAVVLSLNGHGVVYSAGSANKVVRSLVLTGGAQTDVLRIVNSAAAAQALTVESTILSGGAHGIGATTSGALAGNVTITARHVTAAGSTNGLFLDARPAVSVTPVGSIAATLTDSIILDNAAFNYPGILTIGANTATITATRTLQTGDRAALFADAPGRNFRLRPTATAAINQGGFTEGESTTDVDGEARGTTTDLGADEFVNAAPTAKIALATKTPRASQPVTFSAAGSSDREASYGGGITEYRWDFGDGQTQTTPAPSVQHTYAAEGDVTAKLTVADNLGAVSPEVSVPVKLIDGGAPAVGIVKPKAKQIFKLFTVKKKTTTVDGKKKTTTTRTRTKISFGGLSKDKSGIAAVILTFEKLPAAGASASTNCSWYDPKKGFVRKTCASPVLIVAKLTKDSPDGQWSYNVRRNMSVGRYRLSAYGVDGTGAFGNSADKRAAVIRFSIKK